MEFASIIEELRDSIADLETDVRELQVEREVMLPGGARGSVTRK